MPPLHSPPKQSLASAQVRPGKQGSHVVPPQSASLSSPFFTWSVQVGSAQASAVHTPLVQSRASVQWAFVGQGLHAPPPQSRSVSAPEITPSKHEASWHTLASQCRLAQSLLTRQVPPVGQAGQVPPQSRPVSPSSEIRFAQCAGVLTKPKCGTEHEAAMSKSSSSARGNQRWGDAEGNGADDPKGAWGDWRRVTNSSVCQHNGRPSNSICAIGARLVVYLRTWTHPVVRPTLDPARARVLTSAHISCDSEFFVRSVQC